MLDFWLVARQGIRLDLQFGVVEIQGFVSFVPNEADDFALTNIVGWEF